MQVVARPFGSTLAYIAVMSERVHIILVEHPKRRAWHSSCNPGGFITHISYLVLLSMQIQHTTI